MPETASSLSSNNDAAAYAPYSITAILAALLAGLFLVTLLILGGAALVGGQQLVEPLLLIMPSGVLVLAFAARRQINNSEGTRVGLNLCNFAWWVAILGGCGYAAYLVGRNVGVQQDTKDALLKWFALVQKANPLDTRSLDFHQAYQMTIETGRQRSLDAKTPAEVEAAQRGFFEDTPGTIGITRFRQLDLLRILHRNQDPPPQFTFEGLQSWEQDSSGLRAKSAGMLRCPEGEFLLNFDMMRQLVDRPTWRIVAPQSGFVANSRLTRYGQLIEQMEYFGKNLVNSSLLSTMSAFPQYRTRMVGDFLNTNDAAFIARYYTRASAECAAVGVAATVFPEAPGFENLVKSRFFVPLPRTDSEKDGDPREKFYSAWREGRFTPAGLILRNTPDQHPIMTIRDQSIELRVPIEIQLPRMESSQAAARAAVLLVCDDPAFLEQFHKLRKDGATEQPAEEGVRQQIVPFIPWKIVNIASDMKSVTMPKEKPVEAGFGG